MIQKTNANLSFKKAFLLPSIQNVHPENGLKVIQSMMMANADFPENDVFLGADENGELNIHVTQTDKLLYLIDPDYCKKMNMKVDQYIELVHFINMLNDSYKRLQGQKEEIITAKTKDIDNMSTMDIINKVRNTILEFNNKYKKLSS